MIKLDHLYTPSNLPPGTQAFLSNRFSQSVIPTEFVVRRIGQDVLPMIKRTYETGLYFLRNNIVDYELLKNEPGFKGTAHYPHIIMEEVWEDSGVDGHVDYRMVGYVFRI